MNTHEICKEDNRRQRVRQHQNAKHDPDLNGLEFVEVGDTPRTLHLYFLGKAPKYLRKENIVISGGRRVTNIFVTDMRPCPSGASDLDDCLRVTVNQPGDFSCYTLRLAEEDKHGRPTNKPLRGFDPRFAQIEFTFKAGCTGDLDCLPQTACAPAPLPQPEFSYLAKDYASFRQLMLDRLSVVMPDWRERHVPDLGITLVELLAYAGDHLSYFQDAVATEAYLDTARQRISVRRHTRLVDYRMHEGCNARAWVFINTKGDPGKLPADEISLLTGRNQLLPDAQRVMTPEALRQLETQASPEQASLAGQYEVFEPLWPREMVLDERLNELHFYTWGDEACCLPKGTTTATLVDVVIPPTAPQPDDEDCEKPPAHQQGYSQKPPSQKPPPPVRKLESLRAGMVLIFEEVVSPTTGEAGDADPRHRHAVWLTKVTPGMDALYEQPIVEIEWADADALPFALCLSAVSDAPDCERLTHVSIARGNVMLVDHGRTLGRLRLDETAPETLGSVPADETLPECHGTSCAPEVTTVPGRFRPRLKEAPLTFAQPLPNEAEVKQKDCSSLEEPSAARMLRQNARAALPEITLTSRSLGAASERKWQPHYDLLASGGEDDHYVAEIDNFGRAHLRFGDGELGRAPQAEESFAATYRIGNGPAGNVGAETITHLVLKKTVLSGVTLTPRNPMAARGGTPPEPMAEAKLFAPYAMRADLQRAITAEDYAQLAQRHPRVQRAAARLRWTGAWYEVLVAIDAIQTAEVGAELLHEVDCLLRPYRRIGHEVTVAPAVNVPLDIAMHVCVRPGYLSGHVKAALLERFSNRQLPDGTLGFFHPDKLTFGAGIMTSQMLALAQSVTGVENVILTRLQRFGEPREEFNPDDRVPAIEAGILQLGAFEIARLDNDPNLPENGFITFEMKGGR